MTIRKHALMALLYERDKRDITFYLVFAKTVKQSHDVAVAISVATNVTVSEDERTRTKRANTIAEIPYRHNARACACTAVG